MIRDLTGDGRLDVAVAGTGVLSILAGNGDGTLQPPANFTGGGFPTSIAAGCFNNDRGLDLAVTGGFNLLSVLTNTTR